MSVIPIKVLVWNVRGLNCPARRNAISQVVGSARPIIVCFQETKMEVITLAVVAHCTVNRCDSFFYLPAVGTRGGILLAWDSSMVALSNPHYTTGTLTALVKPA